MSENNTPEVKPKKVLQKIVVLTPDGDYAITDFRGLGTKMRQEMMKSFFSDNFVPGAKGLMGTEEGTEFDSTSFNRIIEPPYNPDQLAQILNLNSTHSRCCIVKATDVTSQGYELVPNDEFDTGEEAYTVEEKREMERQRLIIKKLLRECDTKQGYISLSRKLLLDYESIGWMCAEVIRDPEGNILNIVHIPAKEVRITKDGYFIQSKGEKQVRFLPFGSKFVFDVEHEELDLDNPDDDFFSVVMSHRERQVLSMNLIEADGKAENKKVSSFEASANELIMIKQSHPSTSLYGVPEIIPALASLNGNISIEDYLNQFFENNAIPQFLITVTGVDDVDDDLVKTLNTFLKENVKHNAHSTVVIPGPEGSEIKIEKLSEMNQEAGFQDTRQNNREEILIAHGMTPAQVGIIDVANLGSGSGYSQAENYKYRVLIPRQEMFANLFWNIIIGKEGMGLMAVKLQLHSLDIRDLTSLKDRHTVYLDRGVLTINEVREELGREPIEGGNRAFITTGGGITFVDTLGDSMDNIEPEVSKAIKETFKRIMKA